MEPPEGLLSRARSLQAAAPPRLREFTLADRNDLGEPVTKSGHTTRPGEAQGREARCDEVQGEGRGLIASQILSVTQLRPKASACSG